VDNVRLGFCRSAFEAGGNAWPGDIGHESIDVSRGIAAEVDVIGMLVHVERQQRRAASKAVRMVGGPHVR